MNFGPLRSGDPSKELIARVRDIGSRGGADRIASFCRENGIDEQAEQVLRNCRAEVQKVVFDEGQVLGTKNPSAVLMSRIRTAEKRGRSRSKRRSASRSSSSSSRSDAKAN